jgi:hypothetical protein
MIFRRRRAICCRDDLDPRLSILIENVVDFFVPSVAVFFRFRIHGRNVHELAQFCRRHGIRKLSLFGSILRDFGPASDIDVLVEFEPSVRVGLR